MSDKFSTERRLARKIMAAVIGRTLTPQDCVHHKDGNPANNDPDNLQIISRRDHAYLHHAQGQLHVFTKDEYMRGHKLNGCEFIYSEKELIQQMKAACMKCKKLGHRKFSYGCFDIFAKAGKTTIKRRFGSWKLAKLAAGILD